MHFIQREMYIRPTATEVIAYQAERYENVVALMVETKAHCRGWTGRILVNALAQIIVWNAIVTSVTVISGRSDLQSKSINHRSDRL